MEPCAMRILSGQVASRFGIAAANLETVRSLILKRSSLRGFYPGTLNVEIKKPYIVTPDFTIEKNEYPLGEMLMFERCRVRGIKMFIMRPVTHEPPIGNVANVLELISEYRLRFHLSLEDGDLLDVEVGGDDVWWNAPELPGIGNIEG